MDREGVCEMPVISFSPHVIIVCCVDELDRDSHAVTGFLQAPFNHIAHTQFVADLLNCHRFAFVAER